MTVKELLKKNIRKYIDKIPPEDVFETDSVFTAFIERLRVLTKSDIRVQDLLLVITKNGAPLAEIDFTNLEDFANFLNERIDFFFDKPEITISKLSFYEELISKFGAKNNLNVKDKVADALELLKVEKDLLTITVLDDQNKIAGKIRRNNFLDKIIEEVK